MNVAQAAIFGLVEGITEFLPVSSTGHLMLTARWLGIAQTEFVKSFEITIQSAAILAVVILYWKTLIKNRALWGKLLAAFAPTAVVGALLYKFIKGFLLDSSAVAVLALFLGGIALVIFELLYREKENSIGSFSQITFGQAIVIGLFQSIAVIPGVSRSAATIVAGLILGLRRKTIVEFSFLLAIPTMCAAMALDLIKSAQTFNSGQFLVLSVGFLVSFTVAVAAIRFLLIFIKRHTFVPFGIYRILLAAAFWLKFR